MHGESNDNDKDPRMNKLYLCIFVLNSLHLAEGK